MNLLRLVSRLGETLIIASLLAQCADGAVKPPKRLSSPIVDSQLFTLSDNTVPLLNRADVIDQGQAEAATQMPRLYLHFSLTPRQSADLNQLLHDLQSRRSPQFHKFLTPEQYAERFGVDQADLSEVRGWLEEHGFSDIQIARSRNWISFSGNAARTEAAFHVAIHRFSYRGDTNLANSGDPRLPKAFEGLVESVQGLHNFRWHSHLRAHYTSTTGSHYLAPDDWTTVYDVKPLYSAGFNGAGVSIAVVGQSDVQLTDIAAFRTAAGLAANPPTVIIPVGQPDPGIRTSSGDEAESDLDLEWAGAIAPNASIIFVTSGDGVSGAITYAIDNNVAPIISTSYGSCEGGAISRSEINTQNALYQQANAQGITILASAGDDGATDCDYTSSETAASNGLAVDFPASSASVTGTGGTTLTEGSGSFWNPLNNASNGSALNYIPEVVWNDRFQDSTGGGASIYVAKPTWQSGPGVPNDNARHVPDISFAASANHDGYLICGHNFCSNGFKNSSSNLDVVGGTSTGPPTLAGVLALLIEKQGGTRLGNINPTLYSIAQISPEVFHDIAVGNNEMPCVTNSPDCSGGLSTGYSAGVGYDQTTGLGSVDVYNFATQYQENFQISANPATLTIAPGSSANAIITVTPENNFNGNVSFTCTVSSGLVGVTCSVPATTVNTSGTTTVTITADSNAHLPLWRMPPLRVTLLLVSLGLAMALLLFAPKQRLYAASSACLLIIAFGAVSCGGGGTTAQMTGSPTTATLTLSCTLPAAAMPGMVYSGSCSATGGTAPLVFSVGAGALPVGVSLNASTGAISGTPTTPGVASFTVKVTDSGSPQQTTTQMETIVVGPVALSLSCTLPSSAVVGTTYIGTCTGAGGTTPLTYSLVGTLPPGLSLNATTGAVTGTPTLSGNNTFTIKVSDSASPVQSATQAQTITVMPAALTLTCTAPTGATVAIAYTASCASTGGTPPVAYSINTGALPAGLTINSSTGAITGTPTLPGTSAFTIKVIDSASQSATQALTITVAPATLAISATLPAASRATSYTGQFSATGGFMPYTYAVSAGALPPGLTLTAASGLLSGTPTTEGSYAFTVTATDSGSPAHTVSKAVTLIVGPPQTGTVTITATSGGIVTTTTIAVTVP